MELIEGRAIRIESEGPALEGLLHLPEGDGPFPGIVICHPHPQFGGDMYNNVVGALIRASLGSGIAALRFNFRGVGQSEGAYDGGNAEADDVRAALAWLGDQPEINGDRIALAGYSFGAMVALRAADNREDLAALVSVSTPTVAGSKVEIQLAVPALFITGDLDQYCDHKMLLEYKDDFGPDVRVEVVPGVDHFWWGSDERLIAIVSEFLREHVA